MDKATLLKKLDALLDEFDRARMFGSIEIVFRFGKVSTLRRLLTEKIPNERENSRYEHHFESR